MNTDRTFPISNEDLRQVFLLKHGAPAATGWSPRRRLRFGYFPPAEHYEALVNKLVTGETDWIDVGGGGAVFPNNFSLARQLAMRARRLVGVDPSDNVHENTFLHDHAQCLLEDYLTADQFDLATLRMVAEHVADPNTFARKLNQLLRPGGKVVIFTVNRWAPVSIVSHLLPFWLHHPIKKLFWGGEEKDTFPTVYKMNTRQRLRNLLAGYGFNEVHFAYLDDLSVFGRFRILNYLELVAWRLLKKSRLPYPENCLLAVYEKIRDVDHSDG